MLATEQIKLKVTIPTAWALFEILDMVMRKPNPGKEEKLVISIAQGPIDKIDRLLNKSYRDEKRNMLKKEYSLSLKFHEATVLGELILGFVNNPMDDLIRTKLHEIKDNIHQKLT